MRINHNITAMNSYRNFSANGSKLSKNLEKLSTGLKINRAGDDAAGLAISEKMRAQISGIEGATKNAKDGISLIQTAEGALTEVHDMLNRMTTLAEQSANGTYDNDVDRVQLQKEVTALKTEIDRIADSTNYNGLKLLDGSLDSATTNVKDTTQWITAEKTPQNAAYIPDKVDASSKVGMGTIVHSESVAEGAQFSVDLNNTAPDFDINDANTADNIEITIGRGTDVADPDNPTSADAGKTSTTLTVSGAEISQADGDTTAEKIANAIVTKYGKDTGGTGITIYGSYTDENGDVQGNAEHFDVTADKNGKLIFTQTNAPKEPKQVVDTRLQVQVKTNAYEVKDVVATKGDETTTSAAGFALKADGFSFNSDAANSDDVAALKKAISGEANGLKVKLKVDNTDQSNANRTKVNAGTPKVNVATEGLSADYEIWVRDAANGGAAFKVGAAGGDVAASAGPEGAIKWGAGDTELSSEVEIQIRKKDATDTDAALATFKIDMSNLAGVATLDNTNTSTAEDILTLKVENSDNLFKTQDYNAATTEIVAGEARPGERLASTYIKADDLVDKTKPGGSKVKDGAMIEIGGTAYTFAVGKDSTVDKANTKNVVDLTDLTAESTGELDTSVAGQVKTAMQRLTATVKANPNEMYSVGYDESANSANPAGEGRLYLTEKETYSGDADLTTVEGIAKTIRFAEKATQEVDEDGIAGKPLTLQIGDTSEKFNQMSVDVMDCHAASLGLDDVDISTQEGAAKALDQIKNAVNLVSDVRGSMGALQNRLDHTINNLGVSKENIQSAESLIRDTDVAEEMMTYTKNNILNQAAQAMLAQANQLPQGVLQLLG